MKGGDMFEVGKIMVWHRIVDLRHNEAIPVTIVKVARNGVIVEMPDGSRKRAPRNRLLPPKPAPQAPFERPPFAPPTPPAGEPRRLLGKPEGRIPTFLPMEWDPMTMIGDAAQVVHAVPSDNRALCGYESGTGWQWARGEEITCKACWRKNAEIEFEKDEIVKSFRQYGHAGPITREEWIGFNWAGCSIRPWTADHEA
jgi:hypothetical protein